MKGRKKHVAVLNKFNANFGPEQLLLLRYESFFEQFDYLFDQLEHFFGITIDADKRKFMKKEFSTAAAKKKAEKFEDFESYDPDNHIHGKHVYTGKVGTWQQLVVEEDWDKVTHFLRKELAQWDYI